MVSKCLSRETIQNYLQTKITNEERFEVENHLLDCPLCADAVEGFANHYNFEENTELEQIKETIDQQTANAPTEATIRSLPVRRFSMNHIAAAILMLLIPIAGFFYWQSENTSQLAQAFNPIKDDVMLAELRANNTSDFKNNNLKKGMGYYDLNEYQKSLDYYQLALQEEPENSIASFYAGVVSMELENPETAISYLTTSRLNDERFYEQSTWYLIMAHLKLQQKEKAKILLKDLLKNKENIYYDKAMKLKGSLK